MIVDPVQSTFPICQYLITEMLKALSNDIFNHSLRKNICSVSRHLLKGIIFEHQNVEHKNAQKKFISLRQHWRCPCHRWPCCRGRPWPCCGGRQWPCCGRRWPESPMEKPNKNDSKFKFYATSNITILTSQMYLLYILYLEIVYYTKVSWTKF